MASSVAQIPVTVVSGLAGSGKTRLIESLRLQYREGAIEVLYDMGENDILAEVERVCSGPALDAIVIETAPGVDPYAVADVLTNGDGFHAPSRRFRVDTMVTVLNASTFIRDCMETATLAESGGTLDPGDESAISEVLMGQVEFADVLVLNKIDLVDDIELSRVEALVERLNPKAKKVRAQFGRIRPRDVVRTGVFDFEETDEGAGWLAELNGEFDEWGIVNGVSSFTFVERRPFHPLRLSELLNEFEAHGLIRAEGTIWVASRHHEIGIWSLFGAVSVLSYGGAWYAATPSRDWPVEEQERAGIMEEWIPPYGDRRQEIAFIGLDMDEEEIRERLKECLLTSAEMREGPEAWFSYPDPLPEWREDSQGEEAVMGPTRFV